MADLPSEELVPYRNRSLGGGVNTRLFALDIRDDQAAALQNVDVSVPGQRKRRAGYSLIATGITRGPILELSEFKPRGAVNTQILAIAPGASWNELWRWDGSTPTWNFVSALVGYEAGLRTHIVVGQDLVGDFSHVKEAVIHAEGDRYGINFGYTGTSAGGYVPHTATCYWGNGGVLPTGSTMEFAFSQAWATGSGDNEGKLFFSDVVSWTATGFGVGGDQATHSITMGGGRRQNIVAIKGFRNQEVVVWLSDRIEEIVINPDEGTELSDLNILISTSRWQRKIIDDTIGCCAPGSVVKVNEDIYFADQYGNIRSLLRTALDASQGTQSLPISDPIVAFTDRLNGAHLGKIVAQAYKQYYVVSMPLDGATEPNTTFRYDTRLQAWEGPFDIPAARWTLATLDHASAPETLRNPNLYFSSTVTTAGLAYRAFTGSTDDGLAITYRETSKRIDYGQLDLMKQWTRLELIAVGTGTATLMVEANIGTGFQTVGYVDLNGDAPALPHGFPLTIGGSGIVLGKLSLEPLQRSRDIQLQFSTTVTAVDVKILGYNLYAFVQNFEWDVVPPASQGL